MYALTPMKTTYAERTSSRQRIADLERQLNDAKRENKMKHDWIVELCISETAKTREIENLRTINQAQRETIEAQKIIDALRS